MCEREWDWRGRLCVWEGVREIAWVCEWGGGMYGRERESMCMCDRDRGCVRACVCGHMKSKMSVHPLYASLPSPCLHLRPPLLTLTNPTMYMCMFTRTRTCTCTVSPDARGRDLGSAFLGFTYINDSVPMHEWLGSGKLLTPADWYTVTFFWHHLRSLFLFYITTFLLDPSDLSFSFLPIYVAPARVPVI